VLTKETIRQLQEQQFVQEVIISIIAGSLFAFFLSESLTWIHQHWTMQMYQIKDPFRIENLAHVSTVVKVFFPVAVLVAIDLVAFIFLFWKLYWSRVRNNPAKNLFQILCEAFLVLPISSVPWPFFHIFLLLSPLDSQYNSMHIWYLIIWLFLLSLALLFGRVRFGTWIHKISSITEKSNLVTIALIIIIIVPLGYWTHIQINEFQFQVTRNTLKDAQFYLEIMKNISCQDTKEKIRALFDRAYNYTELLKWLWLRLNYTKEEIKRYTDPIKILEIGKGKCQEFAIVYVALCLAHGYESRLVVDWFGDHVWSEVKVQGEWLHVDPSANKINDPSMYARPINEGGWGKIIRLVYAFGVGKIEDITSKYQP